MVTTGAIENLVRQIVRQLSPLKIILFGSYAYGLPTDDSDVDLLVVMPHPGVASSHVAARLDVPLDQYFPMDVLVRSPAEIRRRLAIGDFFIMDIMEKGIILHEANNPRVGEEGRRRLRRRLRSAPAAQIAAK